MTARAALDQLVDTLPESSLPRLLDFARTLARDESSRVADPSEVDVLPGVEVPATFAAPPSRTIPLVVEVRSIRPMRRDLALSDADWEALALEGDDG
jgi:hypothetical protein